jgi:hypothetical protein
VQLPLEFMTFLPGGGGELQFLPAFGLGSRFGFFSVRFQFGPSDDGATTCVSAAHRATRAPLLPPSFVSHHFAPHDRTHAHAPFREWGPQPDTVRAPPRSLALGAGVL